MKPVSKDKKGLIVDTKAAVALVKKGALPAVVFEYVFDPAEKDLLERFVAMQTDPAQLKKFPNTRLRAVALGVPVERLEHWRKTREYLTLMGAALQVNAVEGVAAALPGQISLAANPYLEGSTRAMEAVAKIAKVMKPDDAPVSKKPADEDEPVVRPLTIENLLIQVAMERREPPKKVN